MTDELPGSVEGKLAKLDQVVKNWEASVEALLEDNKRLEMERDEAQDRAGAHRPCTYTSTTRLRELAPALSSRTSSL